MNKTKSNGITLVALVITIIILLILAGVSIAALTESDLFEKARQAEQKSENAQIKEETTLSDYENKIVEYINGNRDDETIEELKNKIARLEDENNLLRQKNFDKVLTNGQISNTSSHLISNFSKNITTNNYILIKLKVDNTIYDISLIKFTSEGQAVALNAHTTINCKIYNDRIESISYNGEYRNIYADIALIDLSNF